MRGGAPGGRPGHGRRQGDADGLGRELARASQHLDAAVAHFDDRGQLHLIVRQQDDAPRRGGDVAQRLPAHVPLLEFTVGQPDRTQVPHAVTGPGGDEVLAVQHVVVVGAQHPRGGGEGRLGRVQGAGAQIGGPSLVVGAAAGEALGAVQVGEARGVGDMNQFALLGPPGLGNGIAAAVDDGLLPDAAIGEQVAHMHGRALPRHARVVPRDPREVLAVG